MANVKDIWGAGGEQLDAAGARLGGEKRPLRDFQPPDYDPRQRRRTDEGFAQQQVRTALGSRSTPSLLLRRAAASRQRGGRARRARLSSRARLAFSAPGGRLVAARRARCAAARRARP